MMWCNGWYPGGGSLFMGFLMVLFWVGVIIGVVYLLKNLFKNNTSYSKKKSPLEILKERYAKGEIADADFDQMRQKLEEKQ